MEPGGLIAEARHHMGRVDWRLRDFDLIKAYVLANFAELAYCQIPKFELDDADRIKLIPCASYQAAARSRATVDVRVVARELDFGRAFVVERRYAVVVGVWTPEFLVIAIRGTRFLYDWAVNFGAGKHRHPIDNRSVAFHKGFFRAILPCLEPISRALHEFVRETGEPPPIYITGHSLGGALAAIMNAIWALHVASEYVQEGIVNLRVPATGCYTFGMPRYGDLAAVSQLREPYHLYNARDIVPTVPPRWLGFENSSQEFRLDGTALENISTHESLTFLGWIARLGMGVGITEHMMDVYRSRILQRI